MRIEVNGVQYHYELAGAGETLLLLHGFTGSIDTWRRCLDRWSERFRIIVVDLLGHGQTAAPRDAARYATEHAVRDLAAILDVLHIEQAHVLGYSMGGRLALSMAMLAAPRVRSLILESSSPGLATAEERAERAHSDAELAARIEREGVARFVEYWENIPLFASLRRLPNDVQQRIREQRLACCASGLAGSLRGMGTGAQPSWWGQLSQLSMPIQLITGADDTKFTAIAHRMREELINSRLAVVCGAGHVVHVEQPEKFDTIVMEFVQSVDEKRMV